MENLYFGFIPSFSHSLIHHIFVKNMDQHNLVILFFNFDLNTLSYEFLIIHPAPFFTTTLISPPSGKQWMLS